MERYNAAQAGTHLTARPQGTAACGGLKPESCQLGAVLAQAISPAAGQWLLLILAGLLVEGGILVFFFSGRKSSYFVAGSETIARTSVYLDAENQAIEPQDLQRFIKALRRHLKGRRADLLYYTDIGFVVKSAANDPADELAHNRLKAYRALFRFGFRPVDMPHRPVKVKPNKNVVEVELALHAYQRALLGPRKARDYHHRE